MSMHACIHICVCTMRAYTYVYAYTHTHTHTQCMHAHAHAHAHAHTAPPATHNKKVSTHTNLLDDRSISAGGREHELPSIQLAAIHLVCQFPAARVNEILRHGRVEGLGEFLGEIFAEYVVARRCEAI